MYKHPNAYTKSWFFRWLSWIIIREDGRYFPPWKGCLALSSNSKSDVKKNDFDNNSYQKVIQKSILINTAR